MQPAQPPPDLPPPGSRRGSAGVALAAALLILGGAPGCGREAPVVEGGLPPPRALPLQEEARLAACGRCHTIPPADALPREAWAEQIREMAGYPRAEGIPPLTPQELADTIAWYTTHAPEVWDARPPASAPDPPTYRPRSYTPAPLIGERIPAVSSITPDRRSGAPPALLLTEMRSGTLLRLPREARERTDLVLDVPLRWNYPARLEHADYDGDGRVDRLVASLGGMNPTNEREGGVLLERGSGGGLEPIGADLARACSVRAGDLDGDGDADLVVCAFGWRGPGQLLWYEQRPDGLTVHLLDERDGFVEAIPSDVDGDGDLDLVAALAQEHELVLEFVNDGTGQFTPRVIHQGAHPGWGTSGIELHDLDGDGDRDILLSHGDTLDVPVVKPYHGVSWLERTAEGGYRAHSIGPLPGCEAATAGDVDGDGDLDVVAVAFLPQIPAEEWRRQRVDSVVLFERIPEGWRRHALERGDPLHPSVAIADADGDGDLDIAVGNYVWIDATGEPRQQREYLTVFYRE